MLNRTAALAAPSTSSSFKPHLTSITSSLTMMAVFSEQKEAHPIIALNDRSRFKGDDRYNTTKVLTMFLTKEFSKHASGGVIVNDTNPGFCKSGLGGWSVGKRIGETMLARSTEDGARCLVLACVTQVPNGSFLNHGIVS